jgi:membrane protease YdiL (CAAX protease family)
VTDTASKLDHWLDRILGPVPKLPEPEGLTPDRRASVILWTSALLMVVLIFRGGFETPGDLNEAWRSVDEDSLAGKMYWVAWGAITYLVLPIAIIVAVMRESPARYGLRLKFTWKSSLVYLALITAMVAPLFWAAEQPSFVRRYPLVTDLGGDWARIWTWEGIRSLRFLCLEFFFRGYLLFGLEKRFGYHAIAVAALPYGVIHFGKPFPEALGAVGAGAILGFMALRTRSIAGGVVVHSVVAASMDLLALYKKGAFE